mgnify:CR=1 FL=1
MKAKEYLQQYKYLEEQKMSLIERMRAIDKDVASIGGTNYGDRVQSSPKNDPIGEIVIELIKKKSTIGLKLTEVRAKQLVIENLLANVSDTQPKFYRVLVHRYIMGDDWKTICCDMDISRGEANRLHGKALLFFEQNVLNNKK